ncbi:MAG: DNA topoisomerase IV subunit A [Erysipelotrichaceae bacterium]|nr:DNA topoisomerase IV subunit A [Erysipelotrichaceae bacterium]
MAKKNKEIKHNEYIISNLEDIMGDRFGRYSKYIIQERALPDARDGLKPVQRRILYAMYHEGNTYEKAHRKSAKTVGLVIGNYHPHGDSSVYDAMVRMSQDWKVRLPLIDMHGNNGSIDDDPAAAMRYTEARLSKVASTLLEDIKNDTVEFSPNFDDTELEPTVLPSRFPLMLVNGATGIAAGYATNIAPHNINEVIEATIYRLQNPTCSLEEIMNIMPGPDFPTGAIVQGKQGIIDAFKTGKGRVVIKSKAEIVQNKSIQQIIITEIPYEIIKSNLVKKMDDIKLSKDLEGIMDVRDESDRNGLKIVVDVKKDADANLILNYFYKNTELQTYYNYNMVAIVNKRPEQLGVLQFLDTFIEHRKEVVLRRSKYLLNIKENKVHIIEGLMKAVSILDEIIAIIRSSKDKEDSKRGLINAFSFTEIQAEAIVNLRLYRLSNTDILELRDDFAKLINEIEEIKTIIENKNVLVSTIVKELKDISKEYKDERRTTIEDEIEEIVIDKLSMITNEKVMITVSKDGYTKKVSLRSYQASEGLTGIKEGDELVGSIEADTIDTLLVFTSKGNYGYLPVYEIEEARWKDVGSHLNNLLKIDKDDKIINAILIKNFETQAYIMTVSKLGMIKKTMINQWTVSRNNKVYPAMKLKKNDEVVKAFVVYENEDVILVSKNGYCVRYSNELVPSTSTRSQGVIAIKLSKGDYLASATTLSTTGNLLVINESGGLKRVRNEDINITNRATKGSLIAKQLKSKSWNINYVCNVNVYDELVFINNEEIKIVGKDIPIMARDATFSNPLTLNNGWYFLKNIEECKIIDLVINTTEEKIEEEIHDDYEQIDIFEKLN